MEWEEQSKNNNSGQPPIFSDVKSQVENIRNKVEAAGHRVFSNELTCQRYRYRRTSNEKGRKVRDRFLQIWYVFFFFSFFLSLIHFDKSLAVYDRFLKCVLQFLLF